MNQWTVPSKSNHIMNNQLSMKPVLRPSKLKPWTSLGGNVWDCLYDHPWTLSLGLASYKPWRAFWNTCQLEILTSEEHLFLLIKSQSFTVPHRVSPILALGVHQVPAWTAHSEPSTWVMYPQWICMGESKEIAIWSCLATWPDGLKPRDNHMSTTDYSTGQHTQLLCPSPPPSHRHWSRNFHNKWLSWEFPGKEFLMVMEFSSNTQWENPLKDQNIPGRSFS